MRFVLTLTLLAACVMPLSAQQVQMAETWQTGYSGEAATGAKVLGYWEFNAGAETKDSSGKGNDLTLAGAQFSPNGKFGGALESFRGYPIEDKKHGVTAKHAPSLSLKGAFTIEMWINPKPEIKDYPESYLLDKKYVAHTDYQMILSPADNSNRRSLAVNLGFGADSDTWRSETAVFEPRAWTHIAFTYDGAGTGRFYRDGRAFGSATKNGRGKIAPGTAILTIGDRIGSLYHGFAGFMDNVRISEEVLEFTPISLKIVSNRKAFVRMEKAAAVKFEVANRQSSKLTGAKLAVQQMGLPAQVIPIPDLDPGAATVVDYNFDTTLKPGEYRVAAGVALPDGYSTTEVFSLYLAARPNPQRMPVVMWGASPEDWQRLLECGFTHCHFGAPVDLEAIWQAGKPVIPAPDKLAAAAANLDLALRHGLYVYAGLSPGRWARSKEEVSRVDRSGKPTKHDVCALIPKVEDFCRNVGLSVAQAIGDFPALESALAHTEVRGESQLCFHDHDKAAFKQATGLDIPDEVTVKNGVMYSTLRDFPADRIIPDNYPIYTYYKWFWKDGDGWNDLHTALDEGLKSTGRKDFWTYHDPAVRVASVWGSGGNVDYLSQWTYSYPDPIRIGLATDELFAMAEGQPGQQVMKMTQIIWYRSQTAPEPGEATTAQTGTFDDQDRGPQRSGDPTAKGYQADWEIEIPDARFITISPMHLREALWTKISRPIQGIMYHGWGSLVEEDRGGYRYTNPATRVELRRLVDEIVTPLGPALKQIPDRQNDVAMLESFASQMLARKGTYGWNGGWTGDAFLILNYAQLQPDVVYDETIEKRGLDQYKVLVLVDCDVLTRSVADKIIAFQKRGGIVIGDQNLAPGITPDILLKEEARPKEADKARELLVAKAAALRKELDPHYQRFYGSDNPDVITRARRYGNTDYLFALNDRREFGDYVGHHKLVMENGLPSEATLYVRRPGGYVYDLVNHRQVAGKVSNGLMQLPAKLGPCDGQLLMVTERPIADLKLQAPQDATRGSQIKVALTVADDRGQAVAAVVPVQVRLIGPDAKEAEFSGYYGAKDGQFSLNFDLAANDRPGLWRLRARELASGLTTDHYIRVK